MKKFVAFSLGALLTMGFAACSDDDVTSTSNVDENSVAYMHLNIITSDDASTRADSNDPVLYQGAENEHKVSSIRFYFFDKNEKYISEYDLNSPSFNTESGTGNNIESKADGVVVVPKYDPLNKPAYMITVLNPLKMGKPATMSEFLNLKDGSFKILSSSTLQTQDTQNYTTGVDANNEFVMTTAVYKLADGTISYATDLTSANFYQTSDEALKAKDYTTVYVERLAAKVGLDFGTSVKEYWTANSTLDKVFKLGMFDLNHTNTEKVALYAKFIGWGLNATAKDTYYTKHINKSWADNLLGNNPWNDIQRVRSYWAESVYYSASAASNYNFPEKYEQKTAQSDDERYTANNGTSYYYKGFPLNFISYNEMKKDNYGDVLYCGENTNSSALISSEYTEGNIAGVVTCALLSAQLQKMNDKGELVSAGNIVKFSGYYYEDVELQKKFFSNLGVDYKYAATTADEANPKALEAGDIAFLPDAYLNGRVKAALSTSIPSDAKWYSKDGTALTDVTTESINKSLKDIQGDNPMVMYRDGMMYYYTPIYHLTTNDISNNTVPEGYYGVVRNHWYGLTITGFRKKSNESPYDPSDPEKNPSDPTDDTPSDTYGPEGPGDNEEPIEPGHGVDDPDEPIIPTKETDIDYYLGVNINVLSWRVANQHIKL
jgi:hypothetical protein